MKECQHCGKADLHWEKTQYGYRLVNPDGTLHTRGECDRIRYEREHPPVKEVDGVDPLGWLSEKHNAAAVAAQQARRP